MHDGPARRDVTAEGKRGAAARHQVMSTDVERLMEVMCRAETATIRAPRKATTTVAAAATARGARTLARSPLARFRRICLALPGAWEKVSHGEPTFWVGKKMFATFASAANHHGAGRHAVWCRATHVTQGLLLARSPERYFAPPYVGSSGWVGIYLDDAPEWAEVADRLLHAHELAALRRRRPAKKGV
jgi:predicted DNA-binding protein (MmcQ/YjbR family)